MPSHTPLLIDLSGVARLADVQRPVVSVWRTRFASSSDPFPPATDVKGGRAFFDAMSVARWLSRTEHGNNPEAIADAAASASPAGFDMADAAHVAAVDALLALRAASGQPVGVLTPNERHRRARLIDPTDSCLVAEASGALPAWAEWADLLADAAYSPVEASRLLERQHAATRASSGSSGSLTTEAEELLVALIEALLADRRADLVVRAGITPTLAAELATRDRDGGEFVVPSGPEARGIRRRLICDSGMMPLERRPSHDAQIVMVRLPSAGAQATTEMLRFIEDIALEMHDHDCTVVVAPATVLTEAVEPSDDLARTDVLRSGRVRAIVKLPGGLITSAPREALALWILGSQLGDVPIAQRFTAVADLTDVPLTRAARTDLASDVLAAMGAPRDIHAHARRFTRFVHTTSLLASRAALVSSPPTPAASALSVRDLPALLDQARAGLGEDAPTTAPASLPSPTLSPAVVEALIADRHLRVLSGTRVSAEEITASGLVTVHAEDLDDPGRIGARRVDPLAFAAGHPSARLTAPGDVVFRTSPTPRAWVDADGSKVVVHPARVLRIDRADPGGLVPEVVAADIAQARGGPGAWRRWTLRRVAPAHIAPLREALAEIASRRVALARRLEALDTYSDLLTAAVVSGTVTLTEPDASPATETH